MVKAPVSVQYVCHRILRVFRNIYVLDTRLGMLTLATKRGILAATIINSVDSVLGSQAVSWRRSYSATTYSAY